MRRRMIDPSFWQSETVGMLELDQRYFFIGLFSNADDQGRLRAHPALLRSLIFKFDDISLDEIDILLEQLENPPPNKRNPFIQVYDVGGVRYAQILNWWRWQHPTWATPSKWPGPPGWKDRIKYRRGNKVIRANWDEEQPRLEIAEKSPQDTPEPEEDEERAQGEPIVSPERAPGEVAVAPAYRGRGRGRGRGRDRGSNSNTRAPPENPAGAGDDLVIASLIDRLKDLGIREGKGYELAALYLEADTSSVLTDWADRWIWHYSKDPKITNPHGMAITALEEFQEPTFFRDDDPRRFTESSSGSEIQH